MTASVLLETLVRGSGYALVALGFAAVLGAARVLNLSHALSFLFGAYATYAGQALLRGALPAAAAVAVATVGATALAALAGWLFFRLALRPTLDRPEHALVLCMAVNVFATAALQAALGGRALAVPPVLEGAVRVSGAMLLRQELLVIPVVVLVFPLLHHLLSHTSYGRAVRALAQNPQAALLAGVDRDRVLAGVVAAAAALAGLAGALQAPLRVLAPAMWLPVLVKSFAVVTVGGLGSLRGALGAAYLLAALEVLTSHALTEASSEFVSLAAVVMVLAAGAGRVRERHAFA
ncbi:MAG TPA: branched-chain amino acid ABC transporter permease [Longimicrobium sp.]|nr:branched-chain amino acid ABC transporter permease [Longimicrobium sp.]